MPYISIEDEELEYQTATAKFNVADLDQDSRQVLEILQEFGINTVFCSYFGGGDEDFAEFSGAKLGESTIEASELKHELAKGVLGSKTSKSVLDYYRSLGEPSPEQRVDFFLEIFANALAIQLLGKGFGTGEFSIDGSFCANIETGEIVDETEQTIVGQETESEIEGEQ